MPYLFTYGTQQRQDIQRHLFGRILEGQADQLSGFRLGSLTIHDETNAITGQTSYPMLYPIAQNPTGAPDVMNQNHLIDGMVYAISHTQLQQADCYEGSEYQRKEVRLQSGQTAWVYVCAEHSA